MPFRSRRGPPAAVAAAVLVVALGAGRSAAQPPPALVPPRIGAPPDVAYPEGASGDAEVVLILVVEKDGAVRSAEVEAGAEPFAEAARRAALGWRFTPATRAGEAIPARIRFAVTFRPVVPEPPAPSGPPEAPEPGAAAPGPPPLSVEEEKALEVVVQAERPPPSVSTLSRAEVRQLPGAFGDPFRAIEILPGVSPIVSGLPFFYVRGAPPGNVGYYLDGVRVPYLFHAAAGPSVIHPALVERVDLYAGGYPARYGRFAGAIVAAETTAPRPAWHGEGSVRLVDLGALVEAPFDGGRGTALVGGRYSYTAAVLSLLSPEVRLDYRDYQARVSYDLTPRDRLTLFGFGSYDLLAQEKNGIETVVFGSEFYRLDARYDAKLRGDGHLRLATTGGFDQTRVQDQRNARDLLFGGRVELRQPLAEGVTLRGGLDFELDGYEADQATYGDPDDPDVAAYNELFPSRIDRAAAAWADVVWQVAPRLEVTPGVRLDLFQSEGASAVGVDPRLAFRLDVRSDLRLLAALGTAHQPPSFLVPVPGLAVASLQGGLQRSLQASAGFEADLPDRTTLTVTAFDAVSLNLSDTLSVRPPGDDTTKLPRSLGSAKGVEVYLRRRLTRSLGGFVSYTLSRATRTIDGLTFPSAFDRTHVLNTAVAYDLGRGWRTGVRFNLYSGAPRIDAPNGLPETVRPASPPRDPAFYRIDFRVEKRWDLGRARYLAFVVEMLNASFNKETLNGNEVGPVSIPSLGLEGGF